jgi:hypothetical protein
MRVPGRGVGIHCSPGIPAAKWYVAGDSSVRRWSNYGIWILAEDERTSQSLAASVHPHHVSSVATPRYHQPKTQSLADRQSTPTPGVAADYRRTPNSVNAIRRKFAKPKIARSASECIQTSATPGHAGQLVSPQLIHSLALRASFMASSFCPIPVLAGISPTNPLQSNQLSWIRSCSLGPFSLREGCEACNFALIAIGLLRVEPATAATSCRSVDSVHSGWLIFFPLGKLPHRRS